MDKQPQPVLLPCYSVLLVDDDPRVRQALTWFFRHADGWHLLDAVADTTSALQRAADLRPHLVVLDSWLAGSDSMLLVSRLCALEPAPLVVVLSSDPDPVRCMQAQNQGAAACLSKLLDPAELLHELRRVCDDMSADRR
jgi:DNA-binding NarL/FixJ family response regulator